MDDRNEPMRAGYPNGVNVAAPLTSKTSELLQSVNCMRGENRELRAAVEREAEELAGENAELRSFIESKWR